jgi:uncharacterized protein with HEPN domain
MSPEDSIRLQHILDACSEAIAFLQGLDQPAFEQDRVLSLAVVKCIEIVGEAASQLSVEFRQQ